MKRSREPRMARWIMTGRSNCEVMLESPLWLGPRYRRLKRSGMLKSSCRGVSEMTANHSISAAQRTWIVPHCHFRFRASSSSKSSYVASALSEMLRAPAHLLWDRRKQRLLGSPSIDQAFASPKQPEEQPRPCPRLSNHPSTSWGYESTIRPCS